MYIFVFASLTTANRVRFHIKNKIGILFDINKISGQGELPGCSYGIYVKEPYRHSVEDIVKSLDVNLIGIYNEETLKGVKGNGVS